MNIWVGVDAHGSSNDHCGLFWGSAARPDMDRFFTASPRWKLSCAFPSSALISRAHFDSSSEGHFAASLVPGA